MRLSGLQRLTLLDFPGQLACTVFTRGCNLRCPFCHNASLVVGDGAGEELSEDEFFAFLESRSGRLGGVCISGGEPTLWADLVDFARKIKECGFLVKLDTNGTRPEVIARLIAEGLVDYIAMDVKNSPENYPSTVGIDGFDVAPIMESVRLIRESSVAHEFRTTVTRELHSHDGIRRIGEWLSGEEKYFLQCYRDGEDILSDGISAPTEAEMGEFLSYVREFIPTAEKR